jgi:hypothetical protein
VILYKEAMGMAMGIVGTGAISECHVKTSQKIHSTSAPPSPSVVSLAAANALASTVFVANAITRKPLRPYDPTTESRSTGTDDGMHIVCSISGDPLT